jgi:hypothetical protein
MKTRNGFVSNSSSSSFIVLFPHKPKSEEDLMAMMFPKWKADEVIKSYEGVTPMTIREIVSRVYHDIADNKTPENKYHANSLEGVTSGHSDLVDEDFRVKLPYERSNELLCQWSGTYHELIDKYNLHEEWDGTWGKEIKKDPLYKRYLQERKEEDQMTVKWRKARKKVVKEVLKAFRSKYKYHAYRHFFEYGDENRGECLLEHEDIFRYLPNITFSNH